MKGAGCVHRRWIVSLMAVVTVMLSAVSAAPARARTRSIGHVFVINLENKNYATTWGPTRVRRI